MLSTFLAITLILTSLFLILLVLIQRGRGGGLAGAFGGMGGQSAFGAKAGDLFTRVTIGVAAFWIVLCIVSLKVMGSKTNLFATQGNSATQDSLPPGSDDKSAAPEGKSTSGDAAAKSSDGADKGGTAAEGEKTSSGPSLGSAPSSPGEKSSDKSEASK